MPIGVISFPSILLLPHHPPSVTFVRTWRREMGNFGCTSVVIQALALSCMDSVSVRVLRSSSIKSRPKWQFCSSSQPPYSSIGTGTCKQAETDRQTWRHHGQSITQLTLKLVSLHPDLNLPYNNALGHIHPPLSCTAAGVSLRGLLDPVPWRWLGTPV